MTPTLVADAIPIHADADGVIRVGNTRVTLDTIVAAFSQGATAEEIAQRYPSLELADIYQVIGYYLHRTPEVGAYLEKRRARAAAVRKQNETRFDPRGVRDRLVARRAHRGQ